MNSHRPPLPRARWTPRLSALFIATISAVEWIAILIAVLILAGES